MLLITFLHAYLTRADDGYKLWLRYNKIDDTKLLQEYRSGISGILAGIPKLVQDILERTGSLDILVNNADQS